MLFLTPWSFFLPAKKKNQWGQGFCGFISFLFFWSSQLPKIAQHQFKQLSLAVLTGSRWSCLLLPHQVQPRFGSDPLQFCSAHSPWSHSEPAFLGNSLWTVMGCIYHSLNSSWLSPQHKHLISVEGKGLSGAVCHDLGRLLEGKTKMKL